MSIFKQNLYSKIINGAAWFLFGVANLFDNMACDILAIIFMVVAIICTSRSLFGKMEEDDEMSIEHKRHAESTAFRWLMMVVCAMGILSFLKSDIVFNYRLIYPFMLGVTEIVVGFLFMHYEKVGD